MIRPSMLNAAEQCGLAPALAAKFPESSTAAEEGTARHAAIAQALRTGTTPADPGPARAVAWVRERFGALIAAGEAHIIVEQSVSLGDPESGELLTEGTPDLCVNTSDHIYVVDFKSRREGVPPAAENLQTIAYGLALGLAYDSPAFQCILVGAGDDWWVDEGPVVPVAEWWPLLDRVKRAAARKPEAHMGAWCAVCWQRGVCPNYRAQAQMALVLLGENTGEAGALTTLTDEQAVALALALKPAGDVLKAARRLLEDYVSAGGRVEVDGKTWGPSMSNGKRSGPSVADLEAAGLDHLIKQGRPFEVWEWRKTR